MATRVLHEPGYVLHHYDWSESSVIVEAFTRNWGRVALIAKGAKRPSSNFRSVLLPLQALQLSWGGSAEIRTLKRAEWGGGAVMPTGERLLSGYYANELLMRLLAREDPHPELFVAYAALVPRLAGTDEAGGATASALRAFELLLLRATGYLPALDLETTTQAPLRAGTAYELVPEGGLRQADGAAALPAAAWQRLQEALQAADLRALATVVEHLPAVQRDHLRRQLRRLLDTYCGVAMLRTRQLARDLQRLKHHGLGGTP